MKERARISDGCVREVVTVNVSGLGLAQAARKRFDNKRVIRAQDSSTGVG